MSTIATKLQWKVKAYRLLRRTTRPESEYPDTILTAQEAHLCEAAYEAGFAPKEIVRVLIRRDRSHSILSQTFNRLPE